MVKNLIEEGMDIDYVNQFGFTALHHFIDLKLEKQIMYLMWKGANQHIMDLNGFDSCDKAKSNGIARKFQEFNNCNFRKKIIPQLPNGEYPSYELE